LTPGLTPRLNPGLTRILLTGKNGQVGWELVRTLAPLGEIVAYDRAGLDLADAAAIRSVVRAVKPDIIVNAAAYTAVDKAESEPALAHAVNGAAPGILAGEAVKLGALLVHYSTDYVFDGAKPEPYTEADAPNPLNVYGASKLAGERAIAASGARHLVLRTSWVYGLRGRNFLLTMLKLGAERDEITVVDDQIGAPTWCRAIAEATAQILLGLRERPDFAASGVYHLSAAGRVSWCGFAAAIMRLTRSACRVKPIPSRDYPLPARRPANSLLDNDKLHGQFGVALDGWDDMLAACLRQR